MLPLQILEGVIMLDFNQQYNIKIQKAGARVDAHAETLSRF